MFDAGDTRADSGPFLGELVAALDLELAQGRQYYMILVGGKWCIFYNGPVFVQ